MVEKVLVCLKCQYVPKDFKNQPKICPKCGRKCIERDFLHHEDIQPYMDEFKKIKKRK